MVLLTRSWFFAALSLSACALDTSIADEAPLDDTSTETSELGLGRTLRVAAGADLVALGVTDDGYALYWGQGSVWATRVRANATPRRVATAASPPLTLVAGRVAMIWTDQPVLGGIAPSALTVWTSAHGSAQASSSSLPPVLSSITAASAVSPDGREVVFTTNVSADGETGDIVRATTDLAHVTTLVAGAQVNPFGACAPHVGFDREPGCGHGDAHVVVAACGGASTGKTLARWRGPQRQVLSTSLRLGSWWSSDTEGDRIYGRRADGASVVWDRSGAETVIETRPNLGWMNRDGSITALVVTSPTTSQLNRTSRTNVTTKIMDLPAGLGFMFANHVAPGIPYYNLTASPTSRDGSVIGGWTVLDPNTGLTDVVLIDTAAATIRTVRATSDAAPSNELTTRDSSYMLYYALDALGGNALFAARRDGTTRQLSTGNTVFEHYGLAGSVLAFSDRAAGDPADLLSTTDILVDDLADPAPARTIARGAHQLYFPTADRRSLVYTSDAAGEAGVFVTRVR